MNIQMVTQESFQWVSGYKDTFKDLYVTSRIEAKRNTDVFMLMWCNEEAVDFINRYTGGAKIVLFIRRYEIYSPWIRALNAKKVDKVIMVNAFLAEKFERMFHVKPEVIYNGVSLDEWTFRERGPGNKIAMVGYITPKKGHQLALQILQALPEGYELHIAGAVQDECLYDYLKDMVKKNSLNVKFYGQVPHDQMDEWLDDKDYILSCAYSEGCPNNVLEAMAKGIAPIVHSWPGAEDQFGCFNSINEAVNEITNKDYGDSNVFRAHIEMNHGKSIFDKIASIVEAL